MSYLFQRGSIWYVKTQGAKRIEKSLHTSDKAQAKVLATSYILAHERELAARRPRVEATKRYEPGLHDGENGERIAATALEVSFYDTAGKLLRVEPNAAIQIVGNGRLSALDEFTAFDDAYKGTITTGAVVQRQLVRKSDDDSILDDYLNHRNATGYARKEAEATWAVFRTMTGGKPLSKCGWNDGVALVNYYKAQKSKNGEPFKVASIHKRLVYLNGAIKHAIKKTGKLPADFINPFSGVVKKQGDDSLKKIPLDDADLAAVRENFGTLSPHDQLLFRVLCTTGLRLGEAFQIRNEQTEKGIRFCEVISRKGNVDALPSTRLVPFPDHLLPHLPAVIDGPLFQGTTNDASHRLNAFLRDVCGIKSVIDPQTGKEQLKTLHSLRHRAISLLTEAECPDNINRMLVGHAKDSHDGYVKVIAVLKKWVDRIDGI